MFDCCRILLSMPFVCFYLDAAQRFQKACLIALIWHSCRAVGRRKKVREVLVQSFVYLRS